MKNSSYKFVRHDPKGVSFSISLPKTYSSVVERFGQSEISLHLNMLIISAIADMAFLETGIPMNLYREMNMKKQALLPEHNQLFWKLQNISQKQESRR